MPYQILVFTIHGKTQKAHTITMNLKYQLQHGMVNLNYLMGHTESDIQGYFEYILKKHNEKIDNSSIYIMTIISEEKHIEN